MWDNGASKRLHRNHPMRTPIELTRKIPGAKIAGVIAGRDWVLKHKFPHRDHPKLFETLDRIRAVGTVNLTRWRPAYKGEC